MAFRGKSWIEGTWFGWPIVVLTCDFVQWESSHLVDLGVPKLFLPFFVQIFFVLFETCCYSESGIAEVLPSSTSSRQLFLRRLLAGRWTWQQSCQRQGLWQNSRMNMETRSWKRYSKSPWMHWTGWPPGVLKRKAFPGLVLQPFLYMSQVAYKVVFWKNLGTRHSKFRIETCPVCPCIQIHLYRTRLGVM